MRAFIFVLSYPLAMQGKTIFDPDFDIDDSGVPHEKIVLPLGD